MSFLYTMTDIGLHRLNLAEFRRRGTKYPRLREPAPVRFEKVEFYDGRGEVISKGKVPYAMQHQIVHSKVYLVGGFNSDKTPNVDAYALHPNVPSVTICGRYGPFPPVLLSSGVFSPPIINGSVVVMQGEWMAVLDATSKKSPSPPPLPLSLLLLATPSLSKKGLTSSSEHLLSSECVPHSSLLVDTSIPSSSSSECVPPPPPPFRAFSTEYQHWKNLPSPPDFHVCRTLLGHTSWGHKFHICTLNGSYTFDFKKNEWDTELNADLRCAVEFENFFIGLDYPGMLVVSQMDSNGMPLQPLKVVCYLEDIFGPWSGVVPEFHFMGLCDDGDDNILWLAYSINGPEASCRCQVCVVLFHIFTSEDSHGNSSLEVVHEVAENFYLEDTSIPEGCYGMNDSWLCTAFACDSMVEIVAKRRRVV